MTLLWRVVGGEVRVAPKEAEWWGSSLAVLVAAIHHPEVLKAQLPGTDPAEVAHEVLADLDELLTAAACADAQQERGGGGNRWVSTSVRRDGEEVVFYPGGEVANLAWCLEIFATAVIEPRSRMAAIARGATAYAASAWSNDIGKASGALEHMGSRHKVRTGAETVPAMGGDTTACANTRANALQFTIDEPSRANDRREAKR